MLDRVVNGDTIHTMLHWFVHCNGVTIPNIGVECTSAECVRHLSEYIQEGGLNSFYLNIKMAVPPTKVWGRVHTCAGSYSLEFQPF